jgi:hypothetical protein
VLRTNDDERRERSTHPPLLSWARETHRVFEAVASGDARV